MTRTNNYSLFLLAVIVLLTVSSCGKQSFLNVRPFADNDVLYTTAIPSGDAAAADSVFVVSNDSWLKVGKGAFKLDVFVGGPEGSVQLPYSLYRDLDLMDDQAEALLCGSIDIRKKAGCYTSVSLSLGKLAPGFYQVRLADSLSFNIGVNPELVESPVDAPEDFDAFWEETLAELDRVPMDAEWTLIAEHSSELRKCYELRIPSLDGGIMGGRIYIPVAAGRYPVRLEYMGYGGEPYWHDPDANPDRIDFLVSVRDQGIFKGNQDRWIDRGLNSKDGFYYRGAFCDVVRAVDFVASLPQVDTARIVAHGESQGGAFTWISAALSPKVCAIAPSVPFLGDYEHYGRIVWWPVHEMYEAADAEGIDRSELLDMLRYFDVKNFTPRITCPVYMAFGLQDPVCPPHTNFSEYNNCPSADKRWHCVPWCGHAMWLESSWRELKEEFLNQF